MLLCLELVQSEQWREHIDRQDGRRSRTESLLHDDSEPRFRLEDLPLFSSWPAELLSIFPFSSCSVQEEVTAVRAQVSKKQGREIVMVCARRSN